MRRGAKILACKVTKYGSPKEGKAMVYEFTIDSSDDLDELTTAAEVIDVAVGSSALDASNGNIYVYSPSKTWELTFPA